MKSVKYLLAFAILLALFAVFNSQEEMSSFIEKKGRYSSQTSIKKVHDIVSKENEDEDEDEEEDDEDEDEDEDLDDEDLEDEDDEEEDEDDKDDEEEDDEDEDDKDDEDDEDEEEDDEDNKDEKPKKKLFTFPKLTFNSTNLREKILKKPLVRTIKHMAKNFTKLFTFRKNKKN